MILLAILLIGMSESNLNIITLQMDNLIKGCSIHCIFQEVFQGVSAHNPAAVVVDFQSSAQVSVVFQHGADKLILNLIVEKKCVVGLERDVCAILLISLLRMVIHQLSFLKHGCAHHSISVTSHLESA